MLIWCKQIKRIPIVVEKDGICQITYRLGENAPHVRTWLAAKTQTQPHAAQLTIHLMHDLNMHGRSSSAMTRLLMDVPDDHSKLWSRVKQSLGTLRPYSLIVLCFWMFIVAMRMFGILVAFTSGSGRQYELGLQGCTLVVSKFLKASASATSAHCLSLASGSRGHSDPFRRIWVIRFQFGWRAKRWDSAALSRNSKPHPAIKSRCDSNEAARLPLYLCINTM